MDTKRKTKFGEQFLIGKVQRILYQGVKFITGLSVIFV